MKKPRPISAIVAAGALCLAVVIFSAYREFTEVEFGENVPSVSWLPNTASNISYYRSYSRTAYEFDIGEQDFVTLAKSREWRLQRIEQEPFTIRRYGWCQHPASPPNSLPADATDNQISALEKQLAAYQATTAQRISNGYVSDVRQQNGGGITAAYDMSLKRAYVFTTPR